MHLDGIAIAWASWIAHLILVYAPLNLFGLMFRTVPGACNTAGKSPGQQPATPILGDRGDTPAGLE